MSTQKVALVASAALAASTVLIAFQPASAATYTNCTGGSIGAVTIQGDLVINRGKVCELDGTTVTGNVKADGGSDLSIVGATIGGEVYAARDAYVDIYGDTTVGGQVRGRDAFGIVVEESTVGGGINQSSPNTTPAEPYVYVLTSDITGGLSSSAGEVLIDGSQVVGAVSTRTGDYTDVVDSVIDGGLTVRTNAFGSVVCESEIYGDSLFDRNRSTLQIGGSGDFGTCDGASFWGGNVAFTGNTADVSGFDISNNIVSGDLTGGGNDPLPTGAGNRVRGEITLPFAPEEEQGETSIQEQSARSAQIQQDAGAVADDRAAALRAKVDQRRAEVAASLASLPSGAKVLSTP